MLLKHKATTLLLAVMFVLFIIIALLGTLADTTSVEEEATQATEIFAVTTAEPADMCALFALDEEFTEVVVGVTSTYATSAITFGEAGLLTIAYPNEELGTLALMEGEVCGILIPADDQIVSLVLIGWCSDKYFVKEVSGEEQTVAPFYIR